MNKAAAQMAELLQPAADSGRPVNICAMLAAMSLDVIGHCAFGWARRASPSPSALRS
jgi:hypothetical protein